MAINLLLNAAISYSVNIQTGDLARRIVDGDPLSSATFVAGQEGYDNGTAIEVDMGEMRAFTRLRYKNDGAFPLTVEFRSQSGALVVQTTIGSTGSAFLNREVSGQARYVRVVAPNDQPGSTELNELELYNDGDGGGGGGYGGGVPAPPGVVQFDDVLGTSLVVIPPPLSGGATSQTLLRRLAGTATWGIRVSGVTTTAPITDITTVSTSYEYAWLAVNAYGDTQGDVAGVLTNPDDAAMSAPTTPAAPTVTKSCATQTISVQAPAWPSGTTSMEVQREDAGVASATVNTWSAAGGSYTDATVVRFISYRYRVRALNSVGASAWGAWSGAIELRSTTTLAWDAPAASSSLSNEVTLAFTPSAPITEAAIEINGLPVVAILDGAQYVATIDSRDYANGAVTLRALGKGADTCWAEATRAVTFDNTLAGSVTYQLIRVDNQRVGQAINRLDVGLKTFALPASARRRYWLQTRLISSGMDGLPADMTSLNASALAALWDKGQPITLEKGHESTATGARIAATWHYRSGVLLEKTGQSAWLMIRKTAAEVLSWWESGYDRLGSIKRDSDGDYWMLARTDDDSGAGLWRFQADASGDHWGEEIALTASAPDARDFCHLGDKVYLLRNTTATAATVRVLDRDSGEAILDIAIPGEARKATFIEAIGSKPILLCVDGALGSNRTRAYDLSFAAPKVLWGLNEAVTTVAVLNGKLLLGTATGLYGSDGGTSAPALIGALPASVSAIGMEALENGRGLVGLTNNTVYSFALGAGLDALPLATLADDVVALATWHGALDLARGVAAAQSTLSEQGNGGVWVNGATLDVPAGVTGTVAAITALRRFERTAKAAVGTPGGPGFVPALLDERLLIATRDSGLLAVLERSAINESSGAFMGYEHDEIYVVPFAAPIAI